MNADQYNRINKLLSEFSTITAALEAAEAEIKTVQLAAAKELLPKHAAAKVALSNLETELREFADEHYTELFPDDKKRTHSTPFGGIQYRKSSSLEFDDEEKVLLKIRAACDQEAALAVRAHQDPRFTPSQLIRQRSEPNLEALAEFDEITLALFGIQRVHKDTFKVVPFDMASDKPAKKARKGKEAA